MNDEIPSQPNTDSPPSIDELNPGQRTPTNIHGDISLPRDVFQDKSLLNSDNNEDRQENTQILSGIISNQNLTGPLPTYIEAISRDLQGGRQGDLANNRLDSNIAAPSESPQNVVQNDNNEDNGDIRTLEEEQAFVEDEAKKFLNRIIKIYIFLLVMSGLSLMIKYHLLSRNIILLSIASICLWEIVFIMKYQQLDTDLPSRQGRLRFFSIFESILIIFFLVGSAAKFASSNFPLTIIGIFGYINTMAFAALCDVDSLYIRKGSIFIFKLLFWTQLMLISLKADDYIHNWAFVFVGLFYGLVFLMSISLGFLIFGCSYICQNYGMHGEEYSIVTMLWDFLNGAFSWIWGFALLGLIEELKDENKDNVLLPTLKLGIIHVFIVTVYTIIFRKQVTLHIMFIINAIIAANWGSEAEKAAFKTVQIGIPSYMFRISPTYFLAVNKDFKITDQKYMDNCKMKVLLIKRSSLFVQSSLMNLSKKLRNIEKSPCFNKKPSVISSKKGLIIKKKAKKRAVSEDILNNYYSDDDAKVLKDFEEEEGEIVKEEDSDKNCVICCVNPSNAVLMGCGHGGVCYNCAVEAWKDRDNCFMCRQAISKILKVKVIDGFNVAKVVEGTKKGVKFPY